MTPPTRLALVVDDDPAVRARARAFLEETGWRVEEATTAAEAEDRLACTEYEIIVLDFVLPDADGVQCMRSWRAMGVTAPVLGLTAASADAVLEAFIKAGAHDVLEKDGLERDAFLAAVEATGGPPGYPEDELPPVRRLRAESGPASPPPPARMDRPRRALVVDDTPTFRLLLRRHLEKDGWTVEEAASADEALAKARPELDLVMLDYLLPDMDGATLLRRLRRNGVSAPVLGMTGHATEEVADAFGSAGALRCVPKEGLNEARLRQAVLEALALAGAR